MDQTLKIALKEARAKLRSSPQPFVELFQHGDCSVELYAPRYEDLQHPHDRDELYVISAGSGKFRREQTVVEFVSGDVLFVAAGVFHRFEEFSADFETWVIFFGPVGGSEKSGDV